MSFAHGRPTDRETVRHSRTGKALQIGGVAAIVATKSMDVLITAAVLAGHPTAEWNPIAAALYAQLGLVGLVATAAVMVGLDVYVTERGAATVRRSPHDWLPSAVRVLGYGPLSILWLAVAIVNAIQVAGAIA